MKTKLFIAVAFSAAIVGLAAYAQGNNGLVPMKGPYKDTRAIQLWPGVAPGSEKDAAVVESWFTAPGDIVARNVTKPTISPFLPPKGKATGAAVIVLPGGGNVVLAMGKEGFDVAKYLSDHGIAAFVLKYRTTISAADASVPAGAVGAPSSGAPRLAEGALALQALALQPRRALRAPRPAAEAAAVVAAVAAAALPARLA